MTLLLSCTLLLLTDEIFSGCEGQLNISSSPILPSGKISFPSSFSRSRLSSTSSLTSNMSSAILPNETSIIASTKSSSYAPVSMTIGASIIPSSFSVSTQPRKLPPPLPHLTSFGIFLVTFGGVLVAFMIVALIWICCRGREKSPQAPHTQVKLKPWSRTKEQSLNDLTSEATDLPTSYQNDGLNSSNPNSPVSGTNKAIPGKVDNIRESRLI